LRLIVDSTTARDQSTGGAFAPAFRRTEEVAPAVDVTIGAATANRIKAAVTRLIIVIV